MPSKSKKQQRFFQLVKAVQNGDVKRKDVTKGVRDAAGSMSKRQVSDFANHISRRKKKVNDGILRFEDFTTLGICEEHINNQYNKFKNMIHIKRINEMVIPMNNRGDIEYLPDEKHRTGEWFKPHDKRVPHGWERLNREDDEPLYRDEDYNEYVRDEYGNFKPVEDEASQPHNAPGKEEIIKTKGGEVRAWMDDKVASDVNGYGKTPNGVDGALDFLTKVCIEAEHDGYAELMYNGNAGWEIQDYDYNTMGFLVFERNRKAWKFQRYSASEAPTKLIADFEIAVHNQVPLPF